MPTGESDPTDVFDLLSDRTRVTILRALARAHRESPTDPWLEYAELRDATGIDDKGNFNYHLRQLDDLVANEDRGYVLSPIGMELVSLIASGDLDADWSWGPVSVSGDCVYCGDSLELRYEDGLFHLECGTEGHALRLPGSPRLVDSHPDESLVERIALVVQQETELARRGICAGCFGPLDGEIHDRDADHYRFHGDCRQCGLQWTFTVGTLVVGHPEVIAFFADRGTDVSLTPFWTLGFCEAGAETVVSTDSLRVRIDVEGDDETLSLTLDSTATVVTAERTAASRTDA